MVHLSKTGGMCLLISATIASALLSACDKKARRTENTIDNEVVYEVSKLKKQSVSAQLRLPGELNGYYETGIMAKVNGYIKYMKVDIGDHVAAGQLLAELEAPELISQLTSAFAEYQSKGATYLNTRGRVIRLFKTNETPGAVSPYDIDLAKTSLVSDSLNYLAAMSKYDAVKQLADYLNITAPFEGIITERALAPGAFVGPNDKQGLPLFRLKKINKLRLHIAVPEKYLAEVNIHDVVKFQVKSFPNEIFDGKITRFSKSLDVQTRSEIVEIEIANPDARLLPGMYAIAIIPIHRQEMSFVVPNSSIVTNMEKQFVIRIKNGGIVEYVDVEKGESSNSFTEVFGNLHQHDTLVNVASDEIKAKTKVKIALKE